MIILDWLSLCKRDFRNVAHTDDGHCQTNVDHPVTASQNIWCACTLFTFVEHAKEYKMQPSQHKDGASNDNPAGVSGSVIEHPFKLSSTTGMGYI